MELRHFKLTDIRLLTRAKKKGDDLDLEAEDETDEDEEDEDRALISGLAAPFNAYSQDLGDGYVRVYEQFAPGAFTRSLAEADAGDRNIVVLWEHNHRGVPLASTRSKLVSLTEDADGLRFVLDPFRMPLAERDAIVKGDMQVSVGFFMDEDAVGWRKLDTLTYERTVSEAELFEFSFVMIPAYPQTTAGARSHDGSDKSSIMRSLEAWRAANETTDEAIAEKCEEARAQEDAEILKRLERAELLSRLKR